ncbi:hypothetical protein [Maricaulis salignorans]|uniref:Uncharacterized protein n=1 Tax=Maricaulis salignorans TaxID=144026 RepID=A0A1G9Q3V8_9PROT|nr:hypothetical protein [Maricaulis salignorans]SDM05714.1 hypothetical protein SAMN04488568_104154 [Maricaulis salignorans]
MDTPLDRFTQLAASLRDTKPRPDQQAAAFAAVALVHAEHPATKLVAATRTHHESLKAALGSFQAPNGSMRWVYAAMLAAHGVDTGHFLGAREALRQACAASKTGRLHAGGARAALILSLGEAGPDVVDAFYAMKRALRPPWWRSDDSVTDTFAAAHVLAGSRPETVVDARAHAEAVFGADRGTRGYRRDGARQCVLLGQAPEIVLSRFIALEDARRADRFLRGRSDRSMTMEWAVAGRTPADLTRISDMTRTMPKPLTSIGFCRTRLASLIAFDDQARNPAGSASALAAVIAAQAAMIAAITASSVAATSAASN